MHPEHFSGFALITPGLAQGNLNELLFENTDSFVEENSLFNHLGNQRFELFFHGQVPLS